MPCPNWVFLPRLLPLVFFIYGVMPEYNCVWTRQTITTNLHHHQTPLDCLLTNILSQPRFLMFCVNKIITPIIFTPQTPIICLQFFHIRVCGTGVFHNEADQFLGGILESSEFHFWACVAVVKNILSKSILQMVSQIDLNFRQVNLAVINYHSISSTNSNINLFTQLRVTGLEEVFKNILVLLEVN